MNLPSIIEGNEELVVSEARGVGGHFRWINPEVSGLRAPSAAGFGGVCLRDFRPCLVLHTTHSTLDNLNNQARPNYIYAAVTRRPYLSHTSTICTPYRQHVNQQRA